MVRITARDAGHSRKSWAWGFTRRDAVLLEVNDGGDLNLAQLARGVRVLDRRYAEHQWRRGYRL